jgi:hypothetical protein
MEVDYGKVVVNVQDPRLDDVYRALEFDDEDKALLNKAKIKKTADLLLYNEENISELGLASAPRRRLLAWVAARQGSHLSISLVLMFQ